MVTQGKKPNFLLIVVDDMGYSDCEPFGGEIRTPNLVKLAEEGVRFRHFYTSSLCAPTRALLLTGVDNHLNGLGVMPPMHSTNQFMKRGYEGTLNGSVATIAELLGDAGYFTCISGKWHLGKNAGQRPEDRGFQRVFSFLGGGASHFSDARALAPSEQPHTVYDDDGKDVTHELPDNFYSTTFYTEKMIEFLEARPKEKPFFGYLAYTAPHDPLQVPDEWLDRYSGQYDGGYPAMRMERMRRMKSLGLIRQDMELNPGTGQYENWEDLTDEQKRLQARKMEIYAAMIEMVDESIGKIVEHLKQTGEYENTIILFMSDNGANPKDPHFYSDLTPDEIDEIFDNSWDNLGRVGSFISIGGAWAEACNTPLSYFKLTTADGGVQVPLIVSGPGIEQRGIIADQLLHVTDVLPTLLDYAGAERPETRNGQRLAPLYGRSWRAFLEMTSRQPIRGHYDAVGFEMIECKAVIKGCWKILFMAPPYGKNEWHLYNLCDDPQELTNVADENPDKLAEMLAEWEAYSKAVGYIEASGERVLSTMSPEEFFVRYGHQASPTPALGDD
ncbi:arylsulfatase [Chelativorans sp. Marseille-P2723]|uniref:arylsulfatase n=1 Tax=Chelativorans sp. Marseille-P2723 TaxID=2709133 RepID=UPI001AEE4EDF|nr:arylsulfatase [Chelativorans sp. Marseille-P2723]